jgi:hypothetical protein
MLRKTTIGVMTGVTEMAMSNIMRGGGRGRGEGTGHRVLERIKLHRVKRSFIENPKGSKSTEQLLSVVN